MRKRNNSIGLINKISDKCKEWYAYASSGVWDDPRNNVWIRILKTLNLAVNSFFDSKLQNKSMSLTYTTVLSIVPAFALLIAIGRGFGLQDLLQSSLYKLFPAQGEGVSTALSFVDSYLSNAKHGLFVGIGIVMLLWSIISLLSSIESAFNSIWGVTSSRSFYNKITDYIAICLMIPVLMICSSGMSIFMSSIVQDNINMPIISNGLNILLDLTPLILCWLAFTLSYYLIPNTKVYFKYAAVAGALSAIAFQVLQLLFLNGQIYVSKYNAIYGSFAFLPLMLIWLQLSWLALLTGCMIAFSMQNVYTFKLMGDETAISNRGWHYAAIIIMSVCVKRFINREKPLSKHQIAIEYSLPIKIVGKIVDKLREAELIYDVRIGSGIYGISPAIEPNEYTVAQFLEDFDNVGTSKLLPRFSKIYKDFVSQIEPLHKDCYKVYSDLLIKDIKLPNNDEISSMLNNRIKQIDTKH